jgi:hypothetical protein
MSKFSDIDIELNDPKNIWFSSSSGLIELSIPLELAAIGYHSGQCDDDIAELLEKPLIKAQMMDIDPQLLIKELREFGAWNDEELSNHADNLARLLWIACGDIVDNNS